MKRPIGIFDSGVGGLTVLKEVMKYLPKESTIYLGDTARVPYGTRSKETVVRYSIQNTKILVERGIKLLVIACNTSSAISTDILKEEFDIPVLGVIEPGSRKAVELTRNGRIGVLGTEATISSGAYKEAINRMDKKIKVFSKACSLLVPLAEEGWISNGVAYAVLEKYLAPMKRVNVDVLILGCTHYPFFKKVIKRIMGNSVKLVDPGQETAKEIIPLLKKFGFSNEKNKKPSRHYIVTDAKERFLKIGKKFLGNGFISPSDVEVVRW